MYFPMPVTIVGSTVDGKPNFMAVSWISMVSYNPYKVAITLDKSRKTSEGIKSTGYFSVNIPDISLLDETDFCGIYSGHKFDKSQVFDVFYGENKEIPLIENCPVSWECKLVRITEIEDSEMFIGEITNAYSEEKYILNDKIDLSKINSFLYDENHHTYFETGGKIEDAYSPGKKLRK